MADVHLRPITQRHGQHVGLSSYRHRPLHILAHRVEIDTGDERLRGPFDVHAEAQLPCSDLILQEAPDLSHIQGVDVQCEIGWLLRMWQDAVGREHRMSHLQAQAIHPHHAADLLESPLQGVDIHLGGCGAGGASACNRACMPC